MVGSIYHTTPKLFDFKITFFGVKMSRFCLEEHYGSVIECLTRAQMVAGFRLTGGPALICILGQDTLNILCLVLVKPG